MSRKAAEAPRAPKRGGVRAGAGRKPGKAREGVRRTLLLSHAAIAVLDALPKRREVGAWVSALIERATETKGDER